MSPIFKWEYTTSCSMLPFSPSLCPAVIIHFTQMCYTNPNTFLLFSSLNNYLVDIWKFFFSIVTHIVTTFSAFDFFAQVQTSIKYYFLFAWRTCFNISSSMVLLLMIFVCFCICVSLYSEFERYFKWLLQFDRLLMSVFELSLKRSLLSLFLFLVCNVSFGFRAYFKIFLFNHSCWQCNYEIIWYTFVFIVLGFTEFFWVC